MFRLGRYFYEFHGAWVDLDQNQQPTRLPALPAWAIPDGWRKGLRPMGAPGKDSNDNAANSNVHYGSKSNGVQATADFFRSPRQANSCIAEDRWFRSVSHCALRTREGRDLKHIRDVSMKKRVLEILESASRGFDRLNAVTRRIDSNTLESLLLKLQAPPSAKSRI